MCGGGLSAQDRTINRPSATPEKPMAASKQKVMLVPFEPRLYFGEIDHAIHSETNLTAKEIRERFRDGINEQLFKAFKSAGYFTVDLMDDTVKYRKDISGIYQHLRYDYLKVPDQERYKAPTREKEEPKIERGQLIVETNSDHRFMNARLINNQVLPELNAKYKTNVYVFVNQLDVKAGGSREPGQVNTSQGRRITVHYTVFTKDGKELNSGIAEEEFSIDLNNPKKIIDRHFSAIASTIVKRVGKGLAVVH
jgi:hypothetical protein